MRVLAKDVIAATLAHYRLQKDAMTCKPRYRAVARPRQVAMYLIRDLCPHFSYPRIGRMMGGRDHTTIMHGVRTIEKLIQTDPDLAKDVAAIRFAAEVPIRNPALWEAYGEAMGMGA